VRAEAATSRCCQPLLGITSAPPRSLAIACPVAVSISDALTASSQPHGTTAYAGSWDQGGESKRPTARVPRIDHGVDRFFTAPQRRRGAPVTPVGKAAGERMARGQRRRERGWGRVLLAGAVGGGLAASSTGLSWAWPTWTVELLASSTDWVATKACRMALGRSLHRRRAPCGGIEIVPRNL
jgi:hypothetical protein